jgi:predicted kinase
VNSTAGHGADPEIVLPHRVAVIPIGAPASGKTTLLDRIGAALRDPRFRHGPDDIRRLAFGTRAYQGAAGHVHEAARAIFTARLVSGRAAGYDATNTTRRERVPLVDAALRAGAPVVAVVLRADRNELLRRNAARPEPDAVPVDALLRFAARVERLSPAFLLEEGFVSVFQISDGVHVPVRVDELG